MPVRILLSYAFRPFFLLSAGSAVGGLAAWLVLLHGFPWPGAPSNWLHWHIHEMVFGFVGAAIAGFLLTAIANWTGRPPVQGALLGVLVAAWVIGRIAMAFAGGLSPWLVVPLELAFPLLLAGVVTRELVAVNNRRNYILAGFVVAFPLLDVAYLLDELGLLDQLVFSVLYLMPHLVIVLITIIGGRIIPAFTTNWLRARHVRRLPKVWPWLDGTALGLTLVVGLADTIAPANWLTGLLAGVAAVIHGVRLAGWRGWSTVSEPLLLILHVGYAWLVIGYGLLGAASFLEEITRSSALHAITAGAMGTMILAMMSRVSLGHTGRRLHASPITITTYLLVIVAAVLRIIAPMTAESNFLLINFSAALWMMAFAGFLGEYWPILTRPRVDSPATLQPQPVATQVSANRR